MSYSQINELFLCCDCKHHLCTRSAVYKVIFCSATMEFKDREKITSCEYYADGQDAYEKAVHRKINEQIRKIVRGAGQ